MNLPIPGAIYPSQGSVSVMRCMIVIPARMASTRFPGKPLCDLYLAMFARMKVKAVTFGDGKAPLPI